jgi:large repetitive protein
MIMLRAWTVAVAFVVLLCGCNDCSLEITTHSVPDAIAGMYYSFNLDSDCGGDTWFLTSFDLPPGIALQSNGDLVGVPSHTGIYSFTVGLVDYDSGDEAYQGYTLTVQPPIPTPLPTPLPTRSPTVTS